MSLPDIPVMGWALIVGVLVGMTGIGLGPIGTPGLLLFFPDITRTVAVASNIISGGIAKISGTAIYQKHGLIVPSIAIAYIVCGFPTLILGSLMLDVVGKQPFFSPLVGGILLLAALSLAVRYLVIRAPARTLEITRKKNSHGRRPRRCNRLRRWPYFHRNRFPNYRRLLDPFETACRLRRGDDPFDRTCVPPNQRRDPRGGRQCELGTDWEPVNRASCRDRGRELLCP